MLGCWGFISRGEVAGEGQRRKAGGVAGRRGRLGWRVSGICLQNPGTGVLWSSARRELEVPRAAGKEGRKED